MKEEGNDTEPQFGVLTFVDTAGSDIKMQIPEEIKKLIEQHKGAATVFSTNITMTSSAMLKTGLSSKTENGQTIVIYNGEQVYHGPTTGKVTTRVLNENEKEWAAAWDGDKVLWENTPGAAKHLNP